MFFRFGWNDVKDDSNFVLSRYFQGEALQVQPLTKNKRYAHPEKICALFGYLLWSFSLSSQLEQ